MGLDWLERALAADLDSDDFREEVADIVRSLRRGSRPVTVQIGINRGVGS